MGCGPGDRRATQGRKADALSDGVMYVEDKAAMQGQAVWEVKRLARMT
jgi:hypothetical protein